MAPIIPWLATLIETELENVIAWKSIVKPDPDAREDQRPRFSDDGSNLRSVVGSPPLDSDSTIQLLEKPGSNARAKIPISDGEVSVLAILSDAAWDAYDKGLDEGEEARKGDLLLCKKLTVVSTTYGPSEERIKLRIEDLELTGNFRRVIGQPTPLLERPSIAASRQKIEKLRLKQLQSEVPAEDDQEEEDEEEEEEGGASDDVETEPNVVGVSANTPNALHDPAPATVAHLEQPSAHPNTVSRMSPPKRVSPPDRTSPATHNTASVQLESQLPMDVTPTQAKQQPRNPVRRTRGGFSIGREGFEPTRGDNLTGPQAPTLHARQALPSVSPPAKPKLLDVLSKLPGQIPKKRSPEPSAPVSAQVVNEEIITETPRKTKRISEISTASESTPVSRKRYRIPRDQKSLLEHPSSWVPSAPGHQFPHPNVPVGLLTAWNAKAAGATNPPPPQESSPIPMIEQSSEVQSYGAVQVEPQATAAAEAEDESGVESEESETSEDKPIEWSQSQSRSQALPPDSSAAHISPRVSRPGSRTTALSGSEHMPISIVDDEGSPSSVGNKSTVGSASRKREQLHEKESVAASQALPGSGRASATPIAHKTPSSTHRVQDRLPEASNPSQRTTEIDIKHNYIRERLSNIPSSLLRSPALSVSTDSPAPPPGPDSLPGGATGRTAGTPVGREPIGSLGQSMSLSFSAGLKRTQSMADNHRGPVRPSTQQTPSTRPERPPVKREPLGPPQPLSTSLKRSRPMADNLHGPTRPSTQQTPDYRRRTLDPKEHVLPSTSPTTPLGAPTGPRGARAPQSSGYDRRNPNATPLDAPTGPRAFRASQNSMSDRRSNGSHSDRELAQSGDIYRPSPSESRGGHIPSGSNPTDRRRSGGSQTPNSTNEMESAVPRAFFSNYRQNRSNHYRDAQRRQWLELNLPTNTSVEVSVPLLLQSYREKYPTDPVAEQDFGKLIQHPKISETEPQTPTIVTNNAHAEPQGRPATQQASTADENQEHEFMDEREGSSEANPTNIFTEFVNGWRNLRPNGAVLNDTAGGRPQRKLDVLSWGFGE